MFLDNSADNRQAYARALKLRLRVKALEDSKKLLGVIHVETHAVITDKNDPLLGRFVPAHFNPSLTAVAGVLERITKQVEKHLAQQQWITSDGRQLLDMPLDLAAAELQ